MNTNLVKLVYFSATGTTKTVLENIAKGIGAEEVEHIDLTLPNVAEQPLPQFSDEIVIFGAPVYGGRLPSLAIERLRRCKAEKTPAVLVVVYGNREFEDALLELKNITIELGFKPFAGAAFIGEHSFASEDIPIANGRPDDKDCEIAQKFGKMIGTKNSTLKTVDTTIDLHVPGSFPYAAAGARPMVVSPVTVTENCTLCGTCATLCPTGAITLRDHVETQAKDCIRCCSCIKNCPEGARDLGYDEWKHIAHWLHENCSERKEPRLFTT